MTKKKRHRKMPPPTQVHADSRTQRRRQRGQDEQAAVAEQREPRVIERKVGIRASAGHAHEWVQAWHCWHGYVKHAGPCNYGQWLRVCRCGVIGETE